MAMRRAVKRLAAELTLLVREAGDMMESTMDFTRRMTADALKGKSSPKRLAHRITTDAIESAVEVGSHMGSDLGSTVRGAVMGVICGLGQVTTVTPAMIRDAVRAAIRSASRVGGDLESVSRNAVEGAVEAGKESGMDEKAAASAAAEAAVESVREIDENLAETVTRTVSDIIASLRGFLRRSPKRPLIAVIDSNRVSLESYGIQLSQGRYRALQVTDLDELDRVLETVPDINLALIDLEGFGSEVWDRCQQLKRARIPFVLLSPHRSPTVQRDAIQAGARGVFIKPLAPGELVEHVRAVIGEQE